VITTVVLLISGLAWIYPDNISKGWDIMPLTLQLLYHRASILGENEKPMAIDPKPTGARFSHMRLRLQSLISATTAFLLQSRTSYNPYILYSNISNDFSDETIRNTEIFLDSGCQVRTLASLFHLY
jgi:hypothetical protein